MGILVHANSFEEYDCIMNFFEANGYEWSSRRDLRQYGWEPDQAYDIPINRKNPMFKSVVIDRAISVTEYLEKKAPEFLIREVNLDNLSDLL